MAPSNPDEDPKQCEAQREEPEALREQSGVVVVDLSETESPELK